jgi:hypothetical protein
VTFVIVCESCSIFMKQMCEFCSWCSFPFSLCAATFCFEVWFSFSARALCMLRSRFQFLLCFSCRPLRARARRSHLRIFPLSISLLPPVLCTGVRRPSTGALPISAQLFVASFRFWRHSFSSSRSECAVRKSISCS